MHLPRHLAAALIASALSLGAHGQGQAPPAPEPTPLERLRALWEAGLGGELMAAGRSWVEPEGVLHDHGEALALVARALFDAGREAEAHELLNRARPSEETRAFVAAEQARFALEADDFQAAIRFVGSSEGGRLRVRFPDHPDSYLLLGKALFRSGRETQAAQLLNAFVQGVPLHPDAPAAWHMLSREALSRDDREQSQAYRERAKELAQWHGFLRVRRAQVQAQPNAPEPRYGLALLWMEAQSYARAQSELEALLAAHPNFCGAWFTLGEAHRSQPGEAAIAAAEAAYTKGIECDPADPRARYNRAQLRLALGREEEARTDFEALLATTAADDARFANLHLVLARMLRAEGRAKESAERYRDYRALGGQEEL